MVAVTTIALGPSTRSARRIREGSITGDSDIVLNPARLSISSSDWACSASRLSAAVSSTTRIPSVRVGGGVRRLTAEIQPAAWRQANSYSGVGPASAWVATASSSTSSIVRSTERSVRLSSSRRSQRSSSKFANAAASRAGDGGPSPRSRASATAEDTLWVSASVSRSASISASAYWRWPPGERTGRGNP